MKAKLGRNDESVSTGGSREGNVLHVTGLHGSGDRTSLFLQDWEWGKVAPSCHMALDMLGQGMNEAWYWV